MPDKPNISSLTEPAAPVQELLRDAFAGTDTPVANAGFRSAVWAKIDARRSPSTWAQWLRGHATGVTAATALCVCTALLGGGLLAYQQNRSQRESQLMRYLASIDAHSQVSAEAKTGNPTLRQ